MATAPPIWVTSFSPAGQRSDLLRAADFIYPAFQLGLVRPGVRSVKRCGTVADRDPKAASVNRINAAALETTLLFIKFSSIFDLILVALPQLPAS